MLYTSRCCHRNASKFLEESTYRIIVEEQLPVKGRSLAKAAKLVLRSLQVGHECLAETENKSPDDNIVLRHGNLGCEYVIESSPLRTGRVLVA